MCLVFAIRAPTSLQPTGPGGLGTSSGYPRQYHKYYGWDEAGWWAKSFHSFNQFSVATGDVASFVNPGGRSNVVL